MKIALAQINTTPGDVAGNTRRIVEALGQAAAQGADLVVLPELTISGYPPLDLVERPAFVEANEHAVAEVAGAARGIHAIVGHIAAAADTDKPVVNAASLVRDGEVICRRDKVLLPNYDVFDQLRYFRPGDLNAPVRIGAVMTGITICEDAWNDQTFWSRRLYDRDPVAELAAGGAELLINIAASPFSAGKQALVRSMLGASARRHGLPLAHVNLVGGNDQLIFAGRSLFIDARGRVVAEAASFEEDLLVIDTAAEATGEQPGHDATADVWQALSLGLRDYLRKCGFDKAVLALSGGIDSALTAAIAAEALGPQNVTAIFMPTTFSSEQSLADARAVADVLGIEFHILSIEELRRHTESALEPLFGDTERGVAEENLQARVRGGIVMAYANKFGCLPLATGNKSELAVGYCTLYGDMVGGLAVIGDVPKVMVYRLAEHANRNGEVIRRSIMKKAPSAELKPDQTDQDVLPPYDVLDGILELHVEQRKDLDEIVAAGYHADTVRRVLEMVDRAEFKRRQAPLALCVTTRAFGPGRRLPIAQKWHRR